jgi:outer membrane lipoprotein-sorting protein
VSYYRWVLAGLVAVGSTAFAQSQDGGAQPLESRVDTVLRQWSDRTGQFTRTIVDPVWRETDTSTGSARYLSPKRARLDITEGRRRESLVLPGTGEAWHYKPANGADQDSVVEIHRLPEDFKERDVLEDGPLPFLFATKPERAKQRYKIDILEEDEKQLRVKIVPKLEEDLRDFEQAEISLDKSSFLPTKILIREANMQQVTYDIQNVWQNIEIKDSDFEVTVPKGWKAIPMEAQAPSSVDRQPGDEPLRVGQREN